MLLHLLATLAIAAPTIHFDGVSRSMSHGGQLTDLAPFYDSATGDIHVVGEVRDIDDSEIIAVLVNGEEASTIVWDDHIDFDYDLNTFARPGDAVYPDYFLGDEHALLPAAQPPSSMHT